MNNHFFAAQYVSGPGQVVILDNPSFECDFDIYSVLMEYDPQIKMNDFRQLMLYGILSIYINDIKAYSMPLMKIETRVTPKEIVLFFSRRVASIAKGDAVRIAVSLSSKADLSSPCSITVHCVNESYFRGVRRYAPQDLKVLTLDEVIEGGSHGARGPRAGKTSRAVEVEFDAT